MKVPVECHFEHSLEKIPRRFRLGSRSVEVKALLDRWPSKNHEYFKIQAEDGIYILKHDAINRNWELTFFGEA